MQKRKVLIVVLFFFLLCCINSSTPSKENISLNYVVGPGDELSITVWGHDDLSRDVTVSRKGDITIAPLAVMHVAGKTLGQVEKDVKKVFLKYVLDPRVSVAIKKYESQHVVALGELRSTTTLARTTGPGRHILKGPTEFAEFLMSIGGPTQNADKKHIKLIKQDGIIITIDLNSYMIKSKSEEYIYVEDGDRLFVPSIVLEDKVFVMGEVRYPKVVHYRAGMRLIEAIAEAGSFTESATIRSTKVVRGSFEKPEVISVATRKIFKKGSIKNNILLEPGDIIYVPRSTIGSINYFIKQILPSLQLAALTNALTIGAAHEDAVIRSK